MMFDYLSVIEPIKGRGTVSQSQKARSIVNSIDIKHMNATGSYAVCLPSVRFKG